MSALGVRRNPHPALELLSLYAQGDLALLPRLRVGSHLSRCVKCEEYVDSIRSAVAELKRDAASSTLTAFEAVADWHRLELEMLGNINVGVAAARCVDSVRGKRTWLPRVAITAGLTALFVAGWATHIPREQTSHLASSFSRFLGLERAPHLGNVVQTLPNGIAVRSQGVTLTILHPTGAVVSLSGNSSIEARYVDESTGQMTITNVYGQ